MAKRSFNYEDKVYYSIKLRVIDSNQSSFDKFYIIRVLDEHENPTNILLTETEIDYG